MSALPGPGGPAGGAARRRRRRWTTWLPLAVLLLLAVEIWLLMQVGHLVGTAWVLVLLLVETAAGVAVLRRAGRRGLEAFRLGVARPWGAPVPGQHPGAVGDALLTGAGGVLLVLPGLLSDVLGLLCIVPVTRRLLRRAFARLVRRRVERAVRAAGGVVPGDVVPGDVLDGDVVDGDVVDGGPRELGPGRR
ncbi:FxsA family protein [Kineococcus sp. SYSU DK006]|uniref:FxsA family protein n=1 Tax=Kineococcus sp. SYSU DK006 TaxID=3383127 RepID=UPI003D7CF714